MPSRLIVAGRRQFPTFGCSTSRVQPVQAGHQRHALDTLEHNASLPVVSCASLLISPSHRSLSSPLCVAAMSSASPSNRKRHARQPSRLSVVSSALSSASEEEPEQEQEDVEMLGDDDEDAEGEPDDDELEDELQEEEEEEDEGNNSSAKPSPPAPSKPRKSLKITLKGRSPMQKKTSARSAASSSKAAATAAAASSSRPTRTVVKNNRGKKLVESESDDEDLLDAEGDEDEEGELDEEEDELEDEGDLASLPAEGTEGEEDDADGEESFLANMPKTARQMAKAGMGEELLELPLCEYLLPSLLFSCALLDRSHPIHPSRPFSADSSKKLKRTEAEVALMRSEVARRRRYQSEKKLDDEKTETINRLLKKQVGRKSTREMGQPDEDDEDDNEAGGAEGGAVGGGASGRGGIGGERDAKRAKVMSREESKNLPRGMFRMVNRVEGTTVSIPGAGVGAGGVGAGAEAYMDRWSNLFPSGKIQVLGEEGTKQPPTATAT